MVAMKIPEKNRSSKDQVSSQVTPELVREISDRVYALLLRELSLERERRRRLLPHKRMRWRR